MDLKSLSLSNLKAGTEDGLEEGQFLAYASTWTKEPDSYGDIVKKGAFADTIKAWKDSGNELPILFGHRMDDPDFWLGGAVDMKEDDHGFLVKGQFDLENPKAKQVYRMAKGRRISQMSFAYDVLEDGVVDLGDEKTARELRKLKLYEVSIVPIGANQDTEILGVKAQVDALLGLKGGKVLAAKHLDSLIAARDSLTAVIKAATSEDTDPDKGASSVVSQKDGGQEAADSAARRKSVLAQVAFQLENIPSFN